MSKRKMKGIQLLAKDCVRQLGTSDFLVRSEQNQDRWYEVKWVQNRWTCNCADYSKRKKKCKHIYAVCYYLALKDLSQVRRLVNEKKCRKCGLDDMVVKKGFRYNRSGPVQMYYCKRCRTKFTGRMAFEGMKNKASMVATALDLYFRGLSLRQVAQHLESAHGVRISHATVYNWIKKYVELVNRFVKPLSVKSSERWHADETLIKVKGDHIVLWSLLDSETRFLIALHVSSSRGESDALELIRKGVETSKSRPVEIVTDGLASYAKAIKKEFDGKQLIHIQSSLREGMNNRMERLFGSLKTRVKMARTFRSKDGAKRFADGYNIYYNFIKRHEALNGRTPSEVAGLTDDKYTWLDLITMGGALDDEKCCIKSRLLASEIRNIR